MQNTNSIHQRETARRDKAVSGATYILLQSGYIATESRFACVTFHMTQDAKSEYQPLGQWCGSYEKELENGECHMISILAFTPTTDNCCLVSVTAPFEETETVPSILSPVDVVLVSDFLHNIGTKAPHEFFESMRRSQVRKGARPKPPQPKSEARLGELSLL